MPWLECRDVQNGSLNIEMLGHAEAMHWDFRAYDPDAWNEAKIDPAWWLSSGSQRSHEYSSSLRRQVSHIWDRDLQFGEPLYVMTQDSRLHHMSWRLLIIKVTSFLPKYICKIKFVTVDPRLGRFESSCSVRDSNFGSVTTWPRIEHLYPIRALMPALLLWFIKN